MSFTEKINIQKLKISEPSIEQLIQRLKSGKGLMFTGAGFSVGTKNILGKEPPLALELANKISSLGDFDKTNDLTYISDIYLEYREHGELLSLLKKQFTLTDVSPQHIDICNLNWKRFYTTNYDNSISLSIKSSGNTVNTVSISDRPIDFLKQNDKLVIHLNGYIENATLKDLTTKIKLSDESYLVSDNFYNSQWFPHFKSDLEKCSALIFIGYSLYDFDIKKILFDNPEFKDKTYFIIREGSPHKEYYPLAKFGHILPIGTNGFAEIAKKCLTSIDDIDDDNYILECLKKVESYDINEYYEIRDSEIDKFLMFGHFNDDFIESSLLNNENVYSIIKRTQLESVLKNIENNIHTFVLSEMGNGKTLFLRELESYLTKNGHDVYIVDNLDGNIIFDLDHLESLDQKSIVLIDDYQRMTNIFKYLELSIKNNILFIASERISKHSTFDFKNIFLDKKMTELSIDKLDNQELLKFVDILTHVGFWYDKSSWSDDRKTKYIINNLRSQLSLSLLELFNSPQIKDRISTLTKGLFENENYKATVFAICLLEYLGKTITYQVISDIALNDAIYDRNLLVDSEFSELFNFKNSKLKSKSGIFSLSLINNHFSRTYTVNQLIKIIKHLNALDGSSEEYFQILKNLLRFPTLERMMPKSKNSLDLFYDKAKNEINWLKKDPHFWVQYAMCKLTYEDYKRAQRYLITAYSLAENKPNYRVAFIDTQQARLYLELCLSTKEIKESFKYFKQSSDLLQGLEDDAYKYRQVLKFEEIFNFKYKYFTIKDRVFFEHTCKNNLERIENATIKNVHNQRVTYMFNKAKIVLQDIITEIQKSRN